MEVLRGVARDLTTAEALSTGGVARFVGTQHGGFAIGRQRVRLMMTGALPYEEGDEIAVAGNLMPDGTFNAFAGKNLSSGRKAYKDGLAGLIGNAAVFVLFLPLCFIIIGVPVCVMAGIGFMIAMRGRRAAKLVERETA